MRRRIDLQVLVGLDGVGHDPSGVAEGHWLEFVFSTSGHNNSLKVVDVMRGKARIVLSSYSGD